MKGSFNYTANSKLKTKNTILQILSTVQLVNSTNFEYKAFQKPKYKKLFACLIVIFSIVLSIIGQEAKNTEHTADKNLKSSARVNPSTLAMEFSLPLGNYPGRAGNSLPVGISYSSKVWNLKTLPLVTRNREIYEQYMKTEYITAYNQLPRFGKRTIAGWSSSLQMPAIISESELYNQNGEYHPLSGPSPDNFQGGEPELGSCSGTSSNWGGYFYSASCGGLAYAGGTECCPPYDFCVMVVTESFCVFGGNGGGGLGTPTPTPILTPNPTPTPTPEIVYTVPRIRVSMPSGSTQEFRKADKEINCVENPSECFTQNGSYLSVDGTATRLEISTDANNNLNRSLHMPDGGKYVFTDENTGGAFYHQASYYVDRNGNKSTFNDATGIWTDMLGRETKNPLPSQFRSAYPPPNQTQDIYLPGISQPYKMTWKKLRNAACINGTEPECQDTVLENTAQELKYTGSDSCQSVLNKNPVNGQVLFAEDSESLPDKHPDTGNPYNGYRNITRYRTCAAAPPLNPDVYGSTPAAPEKFNPVVLSEVELPTGQKYIFKYNEYGEITKITYPTGASERFEYGLVKSIGGNAEPTNRGVKDRFVYDSNGTQTQHWKYETVENSGYNLQMVGVITTAPDNSKTVQILTGGNINTPFGFTDPTNGYPIETRSYDTAGSLRSRTFNKYIVQDGRTYTAPDGVVNQPHERATRDARLEESISIVVEPGASKALMTKSKNIFDSNANDKFFAHLNVKRSETTKYVTVDASEAENPLNKFDYFDSSFANAQLAGVTETDFVYDQNYLNNGILGLPTTAFVLNPANPVRTDPNGVLAKTQTVYDTTAITNYGIAVSMDCSSDPQIQKICWENQNNGYKGLPTVSKLWDSDNGIWIESQTSYDIFGNAVKVRDHLGRESFVEFGSQYKYGYPTGTTAPAPGDGVNGTSEQFKTETNYDFTTGLVLWTKDLRGLSNAADDLVTSYEYNDAMLRPTAVVAPNGLRSETIYSDVPGNLYVKMRTQFDTNIWKEAYAYSDEFGRTTKTRRTDASGDVIVETKYDLMGRVSEVSNPYRTGTQAGDILWSKTVYDAAGRVATVYSPKPFGQTGDSLGANEYGIINEAGLVGVWQVSIDASLRKKRTITNSLGQLARVDEAMAFGGTIDADLGTLSSPQQATSYTYDIKGNMVEVTQGTQKRNFLYDSLGRLIRVKQPEQEVNASLNKTDPVTGNSQWTAGFKYNLAGNLEQTTDAEGTVITNTYDNADRVLTRTYSDGITPTISYKYDLVPNGKGQLIETSNGISTSRTTAFDQLGGIKEHQQITDGQIYTLKYKYNLSGTLIEEEYPNGRVVKNDFDANGNLSRVWGINEQVQQTFANSFSYTATGGISAMKLGNGRWETAKFNERLQVTELGLGHSATDAGVWKLGYEFGELSADGTMVDMAKNTGNIARQTINFNGLSQPFVQTYKYDAVNRLTDAKETTGAQTNWSQNFSYDGYGNRIGFAEDIGGLIDNQTPAVNPLTNRFTSPNYGYDKIGNITQDINENNQLRQFVFNGDNKQTAVMKGTVKIGEYFYDGDGKRVKKKVYNENGIWTETIIFVYSGGRLIAEYSTTPPPTQGKTKYLTEDHLGTPRIITDGLGNVIARRDFLPFGEELFIGVGGRTGNDGQKYFSSEDDVKQKFTGYQKDKETQLDFAEARMYENRHGRFTAVDPLLASGKSANPQTFNRYVYTSNNPVVRVDKNGLEWYTTHFKENGEIYLTAEWVAGNAATYQGRGRWKDNHPYIFYAHNTKLYVVLNPYENQKESFIALEHAEAKMKEYEQQALIDFVAGALSAASITFELTGAAEKMKANPNSEVFKVGQNAGTGGAIASIVLGGSGAANAALNGIGRGGLKLANIIKLCCFVAGTPVHTDKGLVPIEKLKVGDKVLSYNEKTEKYEYKAVAHTFIGVKENIVKIKIAGEKLLTTTTEHPFYVKKAYKARDSLSGDDEDGEWLTASELKVGQKVLRPDGKWTRITSVEQLTEPTLVYNLEVEGNHNYFVGEIGVLTHNCNILLAGNAFKKHFDQGKRELLKSITGTTYRTKDGAAQFLSDITRLIDDETVKFVGKGTAGKDGPIVNVYRGNGITVLTKDLPNGAVEYNTILKSGSGKDLGLLDINGNPF